MKKLKKASKNQDTMIKTQRRREILCKIATRSEAQSVRDQVRHGDGTARHKKREK